MEFELLPWIRWVRTLQGISQAGLTWAEDGFDRNRYKQVRRVAAEIAAGIARIPTHAIADAFAVETGHPTPKVRCAHRRGVLIGALPDRNADLMRLYSGMSASMNKLLAGYGDTELELIADFLHRTANAGQNAADDLANP